MELYLDSPQRRETIRSPWQTGHKASQLVRKNETYYKENIRGLELTENELIKAMIENQTYRAPHSIAGDERR